jgi:glycosidase
MNRMMKKILILVLVLTSTVVKAQLTQPDWSNNAVMYEINVRQYSEEGTFKAVTRDLPRIKSLGVDVLWIMPIHPIGKKNRKGTKGSYYSVQDYTDVSPDYGTKADFKELVNNAHKLGMKVLIDWVANHTAWDHAWITEHKDWYAQNDKGEIVTQYDWTDVAKLNFEKVEMREAMIEAMKYWVSEFDIDGYRCDVAFLVPLDFWEELRTKLEEIKPVYMLAEMEWNADITANPNKYFDNAFNASYGWNFMGVSADFAKGKKSISDFKKEMQKNYEAFPSHMHKMLFLTNHDENSWNGTVDEKYGKNWQLFGVMVYTFPQNLPLIYTGEEVGLNRRMKFFEKDHITKAEWSNKSRVDWYKKMTTLKHDVPAFHNMGRYDDWLDIPVNVDGTAPTEYYAYTRKNGNSEAYIFLNFGASQLSFSNAELNFNALNTKYKVESNAKHQISKGQLILQPNSYIIFYK